jgi:hypothetical protein
MPDFEPVQDREDNMSQYPDPVVLTDYEAYLRRVLPRFVRSDLEIAVDTEIQPIEEQLRARILQVIEEAQNRAFLSYRAMLNMDPDAQSPPEAEPSGISGTEAVGREQTPQEIFSQLQPRSNEVEPLSTKAFSGTIPRSSNYGHSSDSGYASNASRPDLVQNSLSESKSCEILGSSDVQQQARTNSDEPLGMSLAISTGSEDNTSVTFPERFQNMDAPDLGQASGAEEDNWRNEPLLLSENWASRVDALDLDTFTWEEFIQ